MARLLDLPYRPASFVLLLMLLLLAPVMAKLGGPSWVSFLIGLPLYILLAVLTYRRLERAGRDGYWVVLMVFQFNFGPSWDGLAPNILHLGNLLNLLPIALAWLPSRQDGRDGTSPDVVAA